VDMKFEVTVLPVADVEPAAAERYMAEVKHVVV
jgi:hypothetical protein